MTKEQFLEGMASWSDHRLLLWYALEMTKDSPLPVIEFGAGSGSTCFLKKYCEENNREFISYDFDWDWAKKMNSIYVDSWDNASLYIPSSVILVDESPGEHRHETISIMKSRSEIIVIHDSEIAAGGYMLHRIWNLFKYRINCRSMYEPGAEASAVSNKYDMSSWNGITFGDFKIEL